MRRTVTPAVAAALLVITPAGAKPFGVAQGHLPVTSVHGESNAGAIKELQREVHALAQRVTALEQQVNAGKLPPAVLGSLGNNNTASQSVAGSGNSGMQTPMGMVRHKAKGH
jgi:hypothetical protein